MNQKITTLLLFAGAVALIGYFYVDSQGTTLGDLQPKLAQDALAARFEYLSQQGTNACGGGKDIVKSLSGDAHMQGACCGAMSLHSWASLGYLKKPTIDLWILQVMSTQAWVALSFLKERTYVS